MLRYVVTLVLSLLATCRAAVALPGSAVFRRDSWTMHDPGFPVTIDVAPSQDEVWVDTNDEDTDVLHVSSMVLDVSVVFPEGFSTDEALVTMSLFEPSTGAIDDAAFEMFIDSQLQYVTKYRVELDPNKTGDRFVLRVYVEANAAHRSASEVEKPGAKLRAFYARWVDTSPSEPSVLSCEDSSDSEDTKEDGGERVSTSPPTNMPSDLCNRYTMNGRVPVRKWYFDDQTGAERPFGKEYSRATIESFVEDARKHVVGYSAADTFLYTALEKYPLKDKRVLIVGSSERPWIESLCLAQHAASCTTVGRNRLRYNHPKLQTFTTAEFYGENTQHFDVVLAVETIASEGLGRAGDPLDPDGDLKVMQELRKLASPPCAASEHGNVNSAATVFLAVPIGADTLVWNAQRQYGPLRLPLLLQDWQLLDTFGFAQSDLTAPFRVSHFPVFVLRSSASCHLKKAASDEHTEL